MNRTFILAGLALVFSIHAQTQTTARPKTDTLAYQKPYDVLPDSVVEKKLVELALKNPNYSASERQNRINELNLKRVKNSWLNLLTISTTYNDQSFAKQDPAVPVPIVYPKWYLGVTIPLGVIFSQGSMVKTARETIAYGKDVQEVLAQNIKVDIITKYRTYQNYFHMIQMQSELINDVLAGAVTAEDNFKKGLINVELYLSTQRTKNEESVRLLNYRLDQDLIKLQIETLIGMPLELVLMPPPPPNVPSGR